MRSVLLLLILCSCGDYGDTTEYKPAPTKPTQPQKPTAEAPQPQPQPQPTAPAKDPFKLAVAAVNHACVSCHNGAVQNPAFNSEAAVKEHADRICARVKQGSMPPSGGLSGDDKDAILKGLDC